jgi:hypothetical protein
MYLKLKNCIDNYNISAIYRATSYIRPKMGGYIIIYLF